MTNRKNLTHLIALLFVLIILPINAYQELHEPNIVYVNYLSTDGDLNTIGMYSSAAQTIVQNTGAACIQESSDFAKNLTKKHKIFSFSQTNECNNSNDFLHMVLQFYKLALNKSPEETVGDLTRHAGYITVIIEGKKSFGYLSVKMNQTKKIITEILY